MLPFGGAYGSLVGVLEIVQLICKGILHVQVQPLGRLRPLFHPWAVSLTGVQEYLPIPAGASEKAAAGIRHNDRLFQMELSLSRGSLTLTLGLFFLALLCVPSFRSAVLAGLKWIVRKLHGAFVVLPQSVLAWPPLRRLLDSRTFAVLSRGLLKPGLPAALLVLILWGDGAASNVALGLGGGLFLALNILLNSRLGRDLEEVLSDGVARSWQRLRLEIVPELIHFVLDLFKSLLGAFDRVLYSVDEWLRFRRGESRTAFVGKLLLGLAWFVVAYVARLVVVLFVEPTFNPIKHFPTVTVTAKLILPFSPTWVDFCRDTLSFLGQWAAEGVGVVVFLLVPGLAGFLVWELKENWRLYAANRSPTLRPVMVARHGETLVHLLRRASTPGRCPSCTPSCARPNAERRGVPPRPTRSAVTRRPCTTWARTCAISLSASSSPCSMRVPSGGPRR